MLMKIRRGLYVITDTALLGNNLLPAVRAALEGGTVLVQYRDKSSDNARREKEARALLALCHEFACPLLINDDVELALTIAADGVHLGRDDNAIAEARKKLGPHAIIGATCHNSLELAADATAQGASYLAFGAMYVSHTKPEAQVASLSTLTAAQCFGLPIVAIGGIDTINAPLVIAGGADCIAVINSLWTALDIRVQAQQFSRLFSNDLDFPAQH
jgi:thiamine-phosphate diphosphorylase